MKFLRIINDQIIYPFNLNVLKDENPHTLFPEDLSSVDLSNYNIFPVVEVNKPNDYTKIITEILPELIEGIYYQKYLIEDAPQNFIDVVNENKWIEIRNTRNQLLSNCDWTLLQDSPLTEQKKSEWIFYRQSLRDITNQVNPFEINWPEKPL